MGDIATFELTGKTVLLSGGLGRVLAADLAGRGATLLLHGRDEDRGAATLTEVAEASGSDRLSWYRADLASLAEVRGLAEAVGRDHDRLDVPIRARSRSQGALTRPLPEAWGFASHTDLSRCTNGPRPVCRHHRSPASPHDPGPTAKTPCAPRSASIIRCDTNG
jgi:hypothetical protein